MTARWTPQELREWADDEERALEHAHNAPSCFTDLIARARKSIALKRAHADAMEACQKPVPVVIGDDGLSMDYWTGVELERRHILRILSGDYR